MHEAEKTEVRLKGTLQPRGERTEFKAEFISSWETNATNARRCLSLLARRGSQACWRNRFTAHCRVVWPGWRFGASVKVGMAVALQAEVREFARPFER